jgi:hypothetical protein
MRIAAVLILLFTLTAGTASAGGCIHNANQFHESMNEFAKSRRGEEHDSILWGSYIGFVSAVFDGLTMNDLICTDGGTVGDVGDVVLRRFDDWMKANSALPSQTCAYEVVGLILIERFPCDAKSEEKTPAK